jgi:ATP-binding cassette, subfamily B (MDR/TAP), member 1
MQHYFHLLTLILIGSTLGSFLMLYAILTLYGSYLLYDEIKVRGCDPSDGVEGNFTCDASGPDVFGAMLGIGMYL